MTPTISIRPTTSDDALALRRLAMLDDARPLRGETLMALVDDEPVAAVSLDEGRIVADPFRRTADITALLRVHAGRLTEDHTPHVGLLDRLGLAA